MADTPHPALAHLVLAIHLAVIAFNIFGLVVIPLGAWRRWSFVRAPAWRLAHFACLAVVAAQATLQVPCFLTTWQARLSGEAAAEPLVARFVDHLVYWPLPAWVFGILYGALFLYVLALCWLVPPRWPGRRPPPPARA